jgi:amino-acid N-acetyltransferase
VSPTIFARPPAPAVHRLLAQASLPCADLTVGHLEHFFGCGAQDVPRGVVGVELHGDEALLRSLAVEVDARGRGCARALVAHAERHAQESGVRRVYLLTTGAADFFFHLGYKRVERGSAPQAIRATSEFSSLCPVSSVLMVKEVSMATAKQRAAARRNIKKAAKAAKAKRTIAHLPKKTRRALGKQAAKVAKRKRHP